MAHNIPREKVIAYLNTDEVRKQTGIEKAAADDKLTRLLVIEVNKNWFAINAAARRKLAKQWLALWQHSVTRGIVAIIEQETGESVVNYHPNGEVELIK